MENRTFVGITWESLPRGCQSFRLDYQIRERAYRAFYIVLFQPFEWTSGRTCLVSSLTCSSMMLLSGEITNPLAFGFEAKALPDKTLDKLNCFSLKTCCQNRKHITACEMGFQHFDLKKIEKHYCKTSLLYRPRILSCNSFCRNFLSLHERRIDYSYTSFL